MDAKFLVLESGLRWYVVRAKLRKETVVEKRIGDLGLEVFLPWLRSRRRVGDQVSMGFNAALVLSGEMIARI